MDGPIWLDPQIVSPIHAEQLALHGGQEGVRDLGLVDSALNRPRQAWSYATTKPDLATLAASLAYDVCRNHPFLDGNKRTAWVLCRTFLIVNGCDTRASQADIASNVLSLAAGDLSEEAFAVWLRDRLEPIG